VAGLPWETKISWNCLFFSFFFSYKKKKRRVICTSVGGLGLNKFGAVPIEILKAVMMGAWACSEGF